MSYVICAGGKYSCTTCDVTFPYKSKLERHLKSSDHKFFEGSLAAADAQSGLAAAGAQSGYDEQMDHGAPLYEEVSEKGGGATVTYSC